jgi:transposase
VAQRDLRDLTRTRSSFVRERVNLVNRVQKTLEGANIKLASVASDVMGVSGRAMLAALMDGHSDPATMAELSKGRLRQKRTELAKALEGRVKPHHRFILAELLAQIDSLDETLEHFDHAIDESLGPLERRSFCSTRFPGSGERPPNCWCRKSAPT